MRYLDYNKHDRIVREYFGDDFRSRAVGSRHNHDSGYIDILRFFGSDAVDPSRIVIRYEPAPFAFSDPLIEQFAAEMEVSMRAEGRLYSDGPLVMKLVDANFDSASPVVSVQSATYGQQAGSCFALDYQHPAFKSRGETLRRYWKSRYLSTRVIDNPLAICFGVCGFLVSPEARILCQHRTGTLASLESSIGTSVAGSVDWNPGYRTLAELIQSAMSQEISEELGLREGEYTITPLAYAREIFRGEKPQIFCVIETKVSESEVGDRLTTLKPDHHEHDAFEFLPSLTGNPVVPAGFNHETRMNYHLMEEWLAL
jgi:hypothetical protein